MPRLGRLSAIFVIAFFTSACCSLFGEDTTGLAGGYAALAFDDGGSDVGIGGDIACDCDKFAGVRSGGGLDLFFPDMGNYQTARIFGEWLPDVDGDVRPYVSLGATLKRFSYDFGGEFESPGLESSSSSTDLGVNFGVGVQYDGLDRAVPFASVERLQIDGGGFQMLRVGSRFRLR